MWKTLAGVALAACQVAVADDLAELYRLRDYTAERAYRPSSSEPPSSRRAT